MTPVWQGNLKPLDPVNVMIGIEEI